MAKVSTRGAPVVGVNIHVDENVVIRVERFGDVVRMEFGWPVGPTVTLHDDQSLTNLFDAVRNFVEQPRAAAS